MGLRTRMVLALLLAGVLPVAINGYLTWRDQGRVLRQDALARVQQVAQLLAARTNLYVRGLREHVATLADTPDLRMAILRGDWIAAQRTLDASARHHPSLRGTLLSDAAGTARAATGIAGALIGEDVSARPHVALARARRDLVVTDPFRSPVDQRPVLGMAAPILDGDRILAVLGAAVDLEHLGAEIQRVKMGTSGFAVVQTAEGRILAHRDASRIFQLAPEANRATTLMGRGPTGALETRRPDGTRDFTGFATVLDVGWVVLAHIPEDEALASLATLRRRNVTLIGLLLAMVAAVAVLHGRVLARPLAALAEAARALGAGDLHRRVPARRADEVGEVARAFNEMADRRQEAESALERSIARRDALAGLSAAIAADTERGEIVRQVVAATARLLGTPYAVLWRLDPQGSHLTVAAEEVDPALGPLPPQAPIPLDRGLAGMVLREGRPILVADVRNDPRWANKSWPGMAHLCAYVGLPLAKDGAVVGILAGMDRPGRAFTEDEVGLLRALGTQAALAIEKAQLLEDARRAAAEAETFVEVGKLLTETMDLDVILTRIVQKAADLFRAEGSGVGLVERDSGEIAIWYREAGATGSAPRVVHRLRPGEAILGTAIRERRTIWAPDMLADPDLWHSQETRQNVLDHGVPRACLASPVIRGEDVLGALFVHRVTGATFTQAEAQVLTALASQAAIAIENARLYREATERATRLSVVSEIGRAVAANLQSEKLFEAMLHQVRRVIPCVRASLSVPEPGGRGFRHAAAHPPDLATAFGKGAAFVLGDDPVSEAFRSRRTVLAPDKQASTNLAGQVLALEGVLSTVHVPLLAGGECLGVLNLGQDRPDGFAPEHIALLESLAPHLATALENAVMYAETEQRRRVAEAVNRVSGMMTAALNLPKVAEAVARAVVELLQAPLVRVFMHEPDAGRLRVAASAGEPELAQYSPLAGMGRAPLAEAAFDAGAPVLACPIAEDSRYLNQEWATRHGLQMFLALPLVAAGEKVGVLAVHRQEARPLTEEENQTLSTFAAQAAIAIENARLYAEVREALDELSALHEAGRAIAQSLDLRETLQRIVAAAVRLTATDHGAVLLVDEHREELTGIVVGEAGEVSDLTLSLAEPSLAAACFRAGRIVISDSVETDPRANARLTTRFATKAVVAAPLSLGGRAIGVLVVSDTKQARPFTRREVAAVERLAQQAVVAIQNARLYEEASERAEEVTALYEAGQAVTENLDLEETLDRIAASARRLAGADRAFVWLVESRDGSLRAGTVLGPGAEGFPGTRVPADSPAAAARAVREGRPIAVPDALDPKAADPALSARLGNAALLAIPLRVRETISGVLVLGYDQPRAFSPAEVDRMAGLANQAAIAIENARLYAQVTAHAETLEQRVRERTAELERASRAKSEFLANMSHELRTPLNAIIGFADLLKMRSFGDLTPKQERYVTNIQAGGVHLLNLVNDVLDLARVEAGRLELQRERTAVAPIVAQALDAIRPQAEKKNLILDAQTAAALPAVHADPVRLRQILVNLLSNAVKFTPERGRVTVCARAAGGWVEVAVADTGIGIAPGDLPRLFRKFEQLDAGMAKAYQGAGLGLGLTRHLVELHGGIIAAESPGRGRGATFTVRLPARAGRDAAAPGAPDAGDPVP